MEGKLRRNIDGIYRKTVEVAIDTWQNHPMRIPALLFAFLLATTASSSLFFKSKSAHAVSCNATTTGNWSTPGTWGSACGGAGGIPAAGDILTINSNVIVTVDTGSPSVASISFANPTTGANGITIATGQTLTLTGSGTALGYVAANSSANASTITMQGTGNLTVNTGNVVYPAPTGGGNEAVTCAASATGTFSIAGTLGITGNSTSTGLATFDMLTCTLSTTGLTTLTGGTNATGKARITASTGTVKTLGGLTMAGTAGNALFSTSGITTWNNTGTISGGSAASFSFTARTLLKMSGTSAINTAYTSLPDVEVVDTTATLGAIQTVTGLQVDNGAILAGSTFALTSTCAGTGTAGFRIDGTYSGSGGTTLNTATCTIDAQGAGAKAVTNTGTLSLNATATIASTANISLSNTTIAIASGITVTNNGTVTTTGASGITGALSTSTWVNAANSTLNFGGGTTTLLSTGTLTATASPNTVNYNASAVQTCKGNAGTQTYVTLAFGGTSAKTCAITTPTVTNAIVGGTATWTHTTALTLTGTLTISGGTLTTGAVAFVVNGATTISSGTLSLTNSTGTKTLTGLVSLSGGTLNGAATTIITTAGIANNGGTVSITGTDTMSTAGAAFSGSSAIAIAVITVTSPGTVTNTGTVTASGDVSGIGGWTQGTNGTLNANSSTITAFSVTTIDAHTNVNTVSYGGAAQTCATTQYYHLTFAGTTTKTCTPTSPLLGNLTMAGTTAAWTHTTALTVNGNLAMNSTGAGSLTTGAVAFIVTGTTSITGGTLSLTNSTGTKTLTGLVTLTGGTLSGAATTIITSAGITNTSGTVTITGTDIMSTAGATFSGANAIAIAVITMTSPGTVTNTGTVTASGDVSGTGGWTQGTNGTLNVNSSTATAFSVTTVDAHTNVNTVSYGGAAQTCATTQYYHLSFVGTTTKTCTPTSPLLGNLTVAGTTAIWTMTTALTVNGNLSVSPSSTGSLVTGAVAFTVNGTTSITGGTLTNTSNTGAKTYTGTITLTGGTLNGASTNIVLGGGIINTSGTVSITGTATMGTGSGVLTSTTAMAIANITATAASQVFSGAGTITASGAVTVTSPGTVTNNGTVTVTGAFGGTGGWTQGANSTLNLGGGTTTANSITTFTATVTTNTVNYNGTAQTVGAFTYGKLILSTSGIKTLTSLATINSDFTFSGTATATLVSAVTIGGNMLIGDGASASVLTTGAFTLGVTGNVTIANLSSIIGNVSTVISVGGNWLTTGTFTHNSSTVTFTSTATGKTINGGSSNFFNVIFNGSGGIWSPLTSAMTIAGDLTMTNGTFDTSNGTANITVNGHVQCGATCGTINMTSTNTFTQSVGASAKNFGTSVTADTTNWAFFNLTFTASTQTITTSSTPTSPGSVTVSSVLTISALTTLNAGSRTWILSGTGTSLSNSGTLTGGTSTIKYTGSGSSTTITAVANTNYKNLTIQPSSTTTYVVGSLAGQTLNLTGSLVVGGGAGTPTIDLVGTAFNPNVTIDGNMTLNNPSVWSKGSGTLLFDNAAGTVVLTDSNATKQELGAVTIGDGATAKILQLGSSVQMTTLNITNVATLDFNGANTLTLTGSSGTPLTKTGSMTVSTGTVAYKPTASSTITVTNATYHHLTLNSSSTTFNLTTSGITTDTANGGGNLTITAGTLDAVSGQNYPITIGGNYTNNGTFTARSGTVTLNGAATQTLSGTLTTTSAFYNLIITNNSGASASDNELTGFTASVVFGAAATVTNGYTITTANVRVQYTSGATYTFTNINWNGQATGTKIYFRNSVTSGTWLMNVSGTQSVSYVNVSRSDASGGTAIAASNGTNFDATNNTNWTFIATGFTVGGTVYGTDETTVISSGPTVSIKVNGTGSFSAAANGSGVYSIPSVTMNAGDAMTIYLSAGGITGATFTVSTGAAMSAIDIYQNRATTRCDNSCSLTNTNIANWNKNNDATIHATTTSGNLTVDNDWKLLVKANTYAPSGTVTTTAGGSNSYSGDVEIKSGATFNIGANALSVGGGWTNGGTFTASNTTTFASTSSGKTLTGTMTGGSAFNNVIFNGVGGTWSFAANSATVNDLTLTNGTVTAPSTTLTINGNYTNNSTFTHNSGAVAVAGSAQQTLAGTMTGSSQFNNLTFTNTTGVDDPGCGTSFTPGVIFSTAATTAGTFTITTAHVRVRYGTGLTYTFNNVNWNGQSTLTRIYFRNSVLGSGSYLMNITAIGSAQTSISSVDVGRSDASGGAQVIANDGTNNDCSNSTNWMFTESLTISLDSSSVSYGTIQPGSNPADQTTTVTTTTNANNGYVVYAWSTQALTFGSSTIPDWTGTNTTPTTFNSGSYGFGYSTNDTSLVGGTANRFSGPLFAGFSHVGPTDVTNAPVADSTAPVTSDAKIVTYRLYPSPTQVAGNPFSTVIIYVASAKFP